MGRHFQWALCTFSASQQEVTARQSQTAWMMASAFKVLVSFAEEVAM